MPFSFHDLIFWLPLATETGAMLTGTARYRVLQPPLRYLYLLVVLSLTIEIIFHVMAYRKINNLSFIPLYILIEFSLLSVIYRYELKARWVKTSIAAGLIIFTIFILFRWVNSAGMSFQPIMRFVEGVLILLLVLFYFYQLLKKPVTQHLEHTPMFWLSAGLFIYFACDIIIFIFSNYIFNSYSRHFSKQIWDVHAILTTVLYVFYTLALWISPKNYNFNS